MSAWFLDSELSICFLLYLGQRKKGLVNSFVLENSTFGGLIIGCLWLLASNKEPLPL